jgi:hypothetical protein
MKRKGAKRSSFDFEKLAALRQARMVPQTIPATAMIAQGEPTQNINVPIPITLHSRLAIIKAKTRQNMKDLVVLAIKEYVERAEQEQQA